MAAGNESDSTISSEFDVSGTTTDGMEACQDEHNLERKLLDLYNNVKLHDFLVLIVLNFLLF